MEIEGQWQLAGCPGALTWIGAGRRRTIGPPLVLRDDGGCLRRHRPGDQGTVWRAQKKRESAMRIPKVVSMVVVLSLLILALVPAAARAQAGAAGVDRAYHLHD